MHLRICLRIVTLGSVLAFWFASVALNPVLGATGSPAPSANSAAQLKPRAGLKPFDYMDAPSPMPNYVTGARWGTETSQIRTMQKPLDAAESMPHLVTFPEFETTLFTAEPEIIKPIWLTWDERGRLWIAETVDYPNEMQPLGHGRDRLKICEDTDGDGRADKFTVFVDKLSVPTGFVFANGGVIVIHSGQTEFFKDTNGDDKADERRVLFSGWGTRDTHATASNLRWGFDKWIWGVVGYSGFDGNVGGKQLRFGQGFFRFKPDGSALEFVRSSNNNTWGLGFSEEGIIFGSTANNNVSMYMPIPNRFYEAVSGWSASRIESIADDQGFYPITDKVRQVDWHDKYTAGAGGALYTARNFPKEYWNKVQFVTEPTGHLIGKFHIEPRGADFLARNERNFAASDDEWAAPIAAEVGPDGALWVIDWYNYIIQHNPVPVGFQNGKGNAYETPLRDKSHGRIYRVAWKNAKAAPPLDLSKATSGELVATLRNDNLLWRMHAQRLLVERGQRDVLPRLRAMIVDGNVDETGLNPAAVHALWTMHGLGVFNGSDEASAASAAGGMKHPSAGVRRAAVTVLPRMSTSVDELLRAKTLEDSDAQVRLAALLALSEMPASDGAGSVIHAMLQKPENSRERWILDAATSAAARHDAGFLKAALTSFTPATAKLESDRTQNLIPNGSFENERDGKPLDWQATTANGNAELTLAEIGFRGGRSLKISSELGAEASWSASVTVKPGTNYRLSGWIKAANLQKFSPGAQGALLSIRELPGPQTGATKPVLGVTDWTPVEVVFNSGALDRLTVTCHFGGWGTARGSAWFDEVQLAEVTRPQLSAELGQIMQRVTTHYARRGPVDSILPTLQTLKNAPSDVATPVLTGLAAGWPETNAPTLTPKDEKALASLMDALPESARDRLLALAIRWGHGKVFTAQVAGIVGALRRQVADGALTEAQRVTAAERLISLEDRVEDGSLLLRQINLLTSPSLAGGFIRALTESRKPETGKSIIARWTEFTPSARRSAISALMRRNEWAAALLDAVEKGELKRTDLAAEHWVQLRQNLDHAISNRARTLMAAGTSVSADREAVISKLLPLAKEKGNPVRGKEVFTVSCAVCHAFNGQGGKVGPDLTGIGARDRGDILMEVLDPNRSVEANYRLWNVRIKNGDTISGRLETETQSSVEILDLTGQKHVIQRQNIAALDGSALSIMPTGFESLPSDDLKALLEYMAQSRP